MWHALCSFAIWWQRLFNVHAFQTTSPVAQSRGHNDVACVYGSPAGLPGDLGRPDWYEPTRTGQCLNSAAGAGPHVLTKHLSMFHSKTSSHMYACMTLKSWIMCSYTLSEHSRGKLTTMYPDTT